MPHYQFQAVDQMGHSQTGSLDAASTNEAVKALSARGLRVTQVQVASAAPAVRQSTVVSRPEVAPRSQVSNVARPVATPATDVLRTGPSSDKQSTFLFGQLAALFSTGIGPVQALQTLANRPGLSSQAAMLHDMSRRVGEGRSLADAMARYPDFFAPGTIGAVRAGENGGYLPDALESLREQFFRSHKLRRAFWWLTSALVSTIMAIPWAIGLVSGIDNSRKLIDDPNAKPIDGILMLLQGLGKSFLSPMGVIVLVLLTAVVIGSKLLKSSRYRRWRHQACLRLPALQGRTVGENLGHLQWHLSLLSKAGLSPHRSWTLAAEAVPNLAYSESLKARSGSLASDQSLAEIYRGTGVIPREYCDMIETGEMTGTLPKALEQCGQMAQADVPHKEKLFINGARIATMVLSMMIGAVAIYIFFSGYVGSIMKIADIE